mgnify:CR=1 FL=1
MAMSDAMDSDVREVIRRRIELRERDGHERLLLNHVDLRALLDAADELDRIKAELGDPSRHYIMDGWLVIDTGKHTCGTGPGGHYGAHEPGCGLEQALRLDNLPGWPGDERDRLRDRRATGRRRAGGQGLAGARGGPPRVGRHQRAVAARAPRALPIAHVPARSALGAHLNHRTSLAIEAGTSGRT